MDLGLVKAHDLLARPPEEFFGGRVCVQNHTRFRVCQEDGVQGAFKDCAEPLFVLSQLFLEFLSSRDVAKDDKGRRDGLPVRSGSGDFDGNDGPIFSDDSRFVLVWCGYSPDPFSEILPYKSYFIRVRQVFDPDFQQFINGVARYFGCSFVGIDVNALAGCNQNPVIGVIGQGPEVLITCTQG